MAEPVVDCVLFFFQAEDGIRDIGVTGVQTCALPIWSRVSLSRRRSSARLRSVMSMEEPIKPTTLPARSRNGALVDSQTAGVPSGRLTEIGRASCRERV